MAFHIKPGPLNKKNTFLQIYKEKVDWEPLIDFKKPTKEILYTLCSILYRQYICNALTSELSQ